MPSYPNSLPSFTTLVDGVDFPKAEDLNIPNREIEAICHVLGVNPRSISTLDHVAVPRQSPQTVGHYLDMFAYIVKTITGATNWYNANVPIRGYFGANIAGLTVPLSATNYISTDGAVETTEANAQIPVPYACKVLNLRGEILSTQPGTGSLVFNLRKNGANAGLSFTLAASTGPGTVGGNSGSISFAAGDLIDIAVTNNATSASAQIGAWSMEIDQVG